MCCKSDKRILLLLFIKKFPEFNKDIVYLAEKGFDAYGFDITESGIKKTKLLANKRNVNVHAFIADVNDFEIEESFDLVYSTGTIQYLFDDNIYLCELKGSQTGNKGYIAFALKENDNIYKLVYIE